MPREKKRRPKAPPKKRAEAAAHEHHGASRLVVIGSSAGGIEALTKVIRDLPATLNASVVIAQHLGTMRPSFLPTILHGALPVTAAGDGQTLKPATVYVAPPDFDVVVDRKRLRLVAPEDGTHTGRPSIDRLFETAAHSHGAHVLGIILSGSGRDGSKGLQAIKAQGGTTLAITLETARFADMSRAAQQASEIDFVVPLGEVAAKIIAFAQDALVRDRDDVEPILERLRALSNRDFREYKRGTITRRIKQRMMAVGVKSFEDYARRLDADPEEPAHLLDDLQIGVTAFFRDPGAWIALRKVLKKRLAAANAKTPIRIWSAGCATGEESYSIALLVWDILGSRERDVKIYATDTDTAALDVGRRGIYSEQQIAAIPKRLRRGFEAVPGGFRAQRNIRKWLIFGPHDITKNPPIFNLDLLVCRNVLIYFNPVLQGRALQLFHYALQPHGILFLGKSEVPVDKADFDPIDTRWRIYSLASATRRAHMPSARLLERRGPRTPGFPGTEEQQFRHAMDVSTRDIEHIRIYDELLLNALPNAIIAVDAQYRVQTWSAAAERIFRLSATDVLGKDFFHSVPGLPYRELKKALDGALKGDERRIDLPELDWAREGQAAKKLRGTIVKLPVKADDPAVVVLILDDITDPTRLAQELSEANAKLDALVREIQTKNELLQTANEELESANEELQATNEELETANEEHQATNEELETTIEEHQATNEELETTNEELQATNEELETTNDELQRRTTALQNLSQFFEDLVRNIDVGMFALGPDRVIQHANKLGLELLGVDKHSQHAALDAIKLKWDLTGLSDHLERVESNEEVVRVRDVHARKGRRLDVTFAPLRDHDEAFAGFLVSVIDRTQEHAAVEELARGRSELQGWLDASTDPFLVLGSKLEIIRVNKAAQKLLRFKVDPIGLTLDSLVRDRRALESALDLPPITRLHETLSRGEPFRCVVRQGTGPHAHVFDAVFSPVPCAAGQSPETVVTLRDATSERAVAALARDLLATASLALGEPCHAARDELASLAKTGAGGVESLEGTLRSIDGVVEDLLELSKLEHADLPLSLEQGKLSDLLGEVVAELAPLGHRIDLTLGAGSKSPVLMDRDRLGQVLRYALVHAIRSTADETPVEVSCSLDGQDVVVSIGAHGPRTVKRLTAHELGLRLSEQIVLGHHGRLTGGRDRGATRIAIPALRR
jgi:two-component system CheB/CheR fusion protein